MAKAMMNAKQAAIATEKRRAIIEREFAKNQAKYFLTRIGSAIRKRIKLFGSGIAKISFEQISMNDRSVVLMNEALVKKGYNVIITPSYFKRVEDKYSDKFHYAKIKPELDKCMILCANCHAEIHHEESEKEFKEKEERLKIESELAIKYANDNRGAIVSTSNKKRSKMPTKEVMLDLIVKNTDEEIASMYNVSAHTVTMWRKKHSISIKERWRLIQKYREDSNKET